MSTMTSKFSYVASVLEQDPKTTQQNEDMKPNTKPVTYLHNMFKE